MHSLPLFHRVAGARVVVVGDGDMAAAKRRLVERAGGICVGEDDIGEARLAFVAVEDGADAIAGRLKHSGLLVNVADRPALCDFTLPSVLERGDVLVAVSTGGASAGLAKHLRLRLEQFLPASIGSLARKLAAARQAMRKQWPDAAERRAAVDAALAPCGMLDPLDEAAPDRVDRWLASGGAPERSSRIVMDLTSNDPDDLTLRQARTLGTADLILHDEKIGSEILARARADAVLRPIESATEESGPGLVIILRMRTGTG